MRIKASFKQNNHKTCVDEFLAKLKYAYKVAEEGTISSFDSELYHYKVDYSSLEGYYYRNGNQYYSEEDGSYFIEEDIQEKDQIYRKDKYALLKGEEYLLSGVKYANGPFEFSLAIKGRPNGHLVGSSGDSYLDYAIYPVRRALENPD